MNSIENRIRCRKFIDDLRLNLAMSLSGIINILDPDAFVFGGGVSNEIDFLNEIENTNWFYMEENMKVFF